jgi:D-aminopeptidase
MEQRRARDVGIIVGHLPPGPNGAITDVEGVRVGHSTIVRGEGPLVVGEGPVRTGVTVVCPRESLAREDPVFAGSHRLNGNGEMTGLEWIRESGVLTTPVAITNTHSVGVVRDALIAVELEARTDEYWCLPVVAETFDGTLNDINGQHVREEHVREALSGARGGPVEEGSVGGGTGMICHEFKGGIGTASRRLTDEEGGWTVGALVQTNYGRRSLLRVDGAPVGRVLTTEHIPSPFEERESPAQKGSIIVILATDAPLLPHQCDRLAQRASIGLGRGQQRHPEGRSLRTPGGHTPHHDPERAHDAALLRRGGGDRGGDPERAAHGRHRNRSRRHHGARAHARSPARRAR